MDKNKKEKLKFERKMAIRKMLPNFFLNLIHRRQVPLKKMEAFLTQYHPLADQGTKLETLAIVVPCFQHAQFLPKTFASIINQTVLPNEVIFINDRSLDETTGVIDRLIKAYEATHPGQIKFTVETNTKNLGQAMSLNKGIELARTDLIMILNDDDYLMHDVVETMLSFFRRYPELALIGGDMISFDNDKTVEKSDKLIKNILDPAQVKLHITSPTDALKFEDFSCLHITHSGSTFVKKKAESAGLYREKKDRIVRFSDRDFQIRVNLLYPVGTTAQLPFCFWRNDSSVDSGVNS